MRASIKDYAIILLAFVIVFGCGIGIGHMTGDEPKPEQPPTTAAWEEQSLTILLESLNLSPAETQVAEAEIQRTAGEIRRAREETILTYHQRLSELYARLIDGLEEPNAERLRREKDSLDRKIESLHPET